VPEPRPAGQTIGRDKLAFTLDQRGIESLQRSRAQRQFTVPGDFFQRPLVTFRTARERFRGILQRSKIQMRRNFLHRRRNRGFLRVGDGHKDSLLDFLVALNDVILLGLQEFLQFIQVDVDGIGEAVEVVGQQIRVSEPDDRGPCGLRQGASVSEVGIGKMRVPVKVVVDGVVDSATIFISVAEVQRRDALSLPQTESG